MRVVMLEGEPWFVVADVCRTLGIGVRPDGTVGVTENTRKLASDERCSISLAKAKQVGFRMTSNKPATLISESGLYRLIMRSDKPEAKAFQDWVTREVLPAIK